MVLQRRMHQEPNRQHTSAVPLGLSVIDCRAYNEAQAGSEHGSVHAMVPARLRLRMKAACISNHPVKRDTATLKTVALEQLRLDLRNRFEVLQLDEDASPEDE